MGITFLRCSIKINPKNIKDDKKYFLFFNEKENNSNNSFVCGIVLHFLQFF
jgi:hypothetical protein